MEAWRCEIGALCDGRKGGRAKRLPPSCARDADELELELGKRMREGADGVVAAVPYRP